VVLSAPALLLGRPRLLSGIDSDVAAVVTLLALHALVLAPFDLFGGWMLPRRFGRSRSTLGRYGRRCPAGKAGPARGARELSVTPGQGLPFQEAAVLRERLGAPVRSSCVA
jgi:hypothetical protein